MDLKYRYTRGFSDRKHDLLYLEDEKYLFVRRIQSEDGQKIYYGCYGALDGPNGCKARCTLDTKSGKCTRNDKPHNGHDNHEVTYRDMVSLNAMKDHCKYLSENFPFSAHKIPIDEIFLTEMAKRIPGESKLKLKHLERQLYRIRDKEYPEVPKTHAAVESLFKDPKIMEEYGQTMNRRERFYVGSVVQSLFAFHIWASFATINFIKNHITPDKRNYLLDGTFKIIPSTGKLFRQLLIICIEYNNDLFPVFYILMSNRTAESYQAVFEYIEQNVFQLKPASLMTDWELGMRKALKICYPGSILRGCWFHFCSSLRKKFLNLGLYSILKSCNNAKMIAQQFMSLPLLPKEHFEEGLKHIKNVIQQFQLTSTFRTFLTYFNFWVNQNNRDALSVTNVNMRTTSSLESMNSALNRGCKARPHLFKFIDRIRLHEFKKSMDLQNLVDNDVTEDFDRKRKLDKERELKIAHFTNLLLKKEIGVSEFLEAMSTKTFLPGTAYIRPVNLKRTQPQQCGPAAKKRKVVNAEINQRLQKAY